MTAPNRDLGPCIVHWDPTGDNIEFVKTFGGVIFRYEELRVGIKRDQEGETDVDEVTTGAVNPELEVPLTQEEVTNLEKCFARAASSANYLKVSNPVGDDVFKDAKQIIVKPIVNGVISVTNTEWLYIHRAFPRIAMEQTYDNTGQRVTKVTFKGFPDDNSPRIGEMWRQGPAA